MLRRSVQNETGYGKRTKGACVRRIELLLLVCLLFLAAESLQVSASGAQMMYALEKTNVRSGPGTEYEKLGQLEEGEKIFAVELLEEGWYRVVYNGETAYVKQDYLTLYTSEGEEDENTLVFPDTAPAELLEALAEETRPEESAPVESLSPESEPEGSPAPTDSPVSDEPDGEKPKKSSGMITGLVLAAGLLAVVVYAACLIWKEKKGKDPRVGQEDEEAADARSVEAEQKADMKENGRVASDEEKNDLEFLNWNQEDREDD